MKRLVIDLDGTITCDDPERSYAERTPNQEIIKKIRQYKRDGFEIIYSARNMRTHNNSVGKINALTLPVIIDWLNRYEIPFDEIYVGKPWCGTEGFYVDDRAIRPAEFLAMSPEEIRTLLSSGQNS